jgi:HEAT repeat protein/ATP/ADP translocase
MRFKPLSLLNIRDEEKSRALMLFLYQFLSVAVMVLGRIVRDTLFLKRYDSSKLPFMYIGVALIVSTATYFYTKKSFYYRLDKLIIGTFFVNIFGTLLLLFLVKGAVTVSFPALYIFIELMGAFMMFQFWSFANELLDSREAKRVLGFVGGGGVLASLIAGFGVGEFVKYLAVENLLILNSVFMGICMYIVRNIGAKYTVRLQRGVVAKTATKLNKNMRINIFASPYVKYIAFVTAFIFIAVTFVDYQFKIVAGNHFKESELASFFGVIYAIFGGIVSLVFQFFITSRLLKHSIFISLGILPAMITLFSGLFFVVPESFVILSWSAPLIAITMARASDYTFRYTINDAAMQLLYIPLNPKLKSRAKALIDGIIKPLFIGFSGLAIYLISLLGFGTRFISVTVSIVGILWLGAILFIRKEYLSVLVDNIKKKRFGNNGFSVKDNLIENIIIEAVENGKEDEVLMALDMVEKGNLYSFSRNFIPLLNHESPKIKTKILFLLRNMESRFYIYEILKLLKDENDCVVEEAVRTYGYMQMEKSVNHLSQFLESEKIDVKKAAIISLIKYGGISGIMMAAPHLKLLSESGKDVDRATAANILGEIGQKNMQYQVFKLLNDSSPIVRREAVKAARAIGSKIFIPKLFYMLLDKNVSFDASKSLSIYGDLVIEPAMDILSNSLESFRLKSEVAKMLGDVNSKLSVALLMKSLDTKSDELRNIILQSLKKLVSKRDDIVIEINDLRRVLSKEIYLYFQTLYMAVKIRSSLKTEHLNPVLDTKLANNYQRIFSILSLIYGDSLFDNIYFNLTQKFVSTAERSNALEIVDNMVDKDTRPIIVPLIEARDNDEKLRLGYQFFKIKQLTVEETLETLMIDDSEWVRAISIHTIAEEKMMEISDKLSMFLYDPSPIVRESAIYALKRLNIKIAREDIKYLKNDADVFVRKYVEYSTSGEAKDIA